MNGIHHYLFSLFSSLGDTFVFPFKFPSRVKSGDDNVMMRTRRTKNAVIDHE